MPTKTKTTRFAKGKQGDLFVDVCNGERLPCLKDTYWMTGQSYREEQYYDLNKPKCAEYIEALQRGRAIVAKYDQARRPGEGEKRIGYIENRIILVDSVRNDPVHGFSCRIVGSEHV